VLVLQTVLPALMLLKAESTVHCRGGTHNPFAPSFDFMDRCLAMGIQGRFRIADGGRSRLDDLRRAVYLTIRRVRGEPAQELSPQWRGVVARGPRLARLLPLWAAGAFGAAALAAAYIGLAWSLGRQAARSTRPRAPSCTRTARTGSM